LAYISLYRKWRPQGFEEVIGQEYVTRTLQNSLRNGTYAHAFLFAGPRGTGKTSTARILAKALNCEKGPAPNPCNLCESCRDITEGTSVDIVEIDAASNRGIDDIRDLRERVAFSPASARVKVYILDEAHMLTPPAFNALLKILEEPPAHVVFVLATTEPYKMPPTILSRCQRFEFRSVPVSRLVEHLKRVSGEEGAEASEEALRLIARRARGSVRDALVILEQVISYGDGLVDEKEVAGFLGLIEDEALVELGDCLARGDTAGIVALVEKTYEEGRDPVQFAREAQEHFRRVFLLQYADLGPDDLEVDEGTHQKLRSQAGALSPNRTFHFIAALREAVREMQSSSSPRLVLEGTLVGMARSELDVSPEALSARLGKLEDELERWARREKMEVSSLRGSRDAGMAEVTETPPASATAAGGEEEAAGEAVSVRVGEEKSGEAPGAVAEAGVEGRGDVRVDLAAVRRVWPQIRERVKEIKVTTHAFLLEGKPQEVRGGELVILFPPDRSFHRGEMEKESHRGVLERALEEILGVGLRVTAALEEEPEVIEEGKAPDKEEEPEVIEEGRAPDKEEARERAEQPRDGAGDEEEKVETRAGKAEREEKKGARRGEKAGEAHDAGKVKLVKDVFGAEVIEEIKLGEED